MNVFLTRRRFLAAVSAVGIVAPCASPSTRAADPAKAESEKPEPTKTDRELIAGTWLLARIGSLGVEKKPTEGDSITLTVENETFKAIVVRDGDTLDVVGSYSLVDKETPKLLDLVVQNGDKAMSVYCLYELEKNVFKIRFNAATGERPPDFKTEVEGGMTLIFHRKKN
jgi:uncharacterized protein (TIGR03067 family)